GAVTLANDLSINAADAVTFGSTINSANLVTRGALSITTTGDPITFSGAIGQNFRLGAITISGTPTGIDAGTNNISASSFVTSTPSSGNINLQGVQNYDGALGLNLKTTGASGNITVGQVTTTAGGVSFANSQKLSILGNVASSGAITQVAGTGGTPTVELGVVANGTTLA
ncbi:MAG: hypothetical protein ACKO7B_11750, partial [Flavobacteriales bacterium]